MSTQINSTQPPVIHLLPANVYEKIAAGEVIERPASIVKELLENSLDANATEVEIRLEAGGKSLIEVTDNGHGMTEVGLGICGVRHATSKLKSFEELTTIKSFGFRGEALPSIAASASLRIISRVEGAQKSFEWKPNFERARPTTATHFIGHSWGTKIQVENLFSEIPARLKFLKSIPAEVSQVREWCERLALTHPNTGFKLISDNKVLLNLRPGQGNETSLIERIRSVLSASPDAPVTLEELSYETLKLKIYWLQGASLKQARKLVQIVNGRAVRDKIIHQAIMASFRQALLPGQFPALVLFIEINPEKIDINVHPAKTEIRFQNSSEIFQAIRKLVSNLLTKDGASHLASDSNAHTFFESGEINHDEINSEAFYKSYSRPIQNEMDLTATRNVEAINDSANSHTSPDQAPVFGRFSGTLFNTYILYEYGDTLTVIDQHAAHERVLFEKLLETFADKNAKIQSQNLLIPETAYFNEEQKNDIETKIKWLTQIGFDVERFSETSIVFRSIPALWGIDSIKPRLQNLLDRILNLGPNNSQNIPSTNDIIMDETLFEAIASAACHSSVRAGQRLDKEQADALIYQLFKCKHPWNCPHGRPTIVKIKKTRFEEWFQRKL